MWNFLIWLLTLTAGFVYGRWGRRHIDCHNLTPVVEAISQLLRSFGFKTTSNVTLSDDGQKALLLLSCQGKAHQIMVPVHSITDGSYTVDAHGVTKNQTPVEISVINFHHNSATYVIGLPSQACSLGFESITVNVTKYPPDTSLPTTRTYTGTETIKLLFEPTASLEAYD